MTTYYTHLERLIVRMPVDRVALRLAVGDFVHTEMGQSFVDYHIKHLALLEWHHKHTNSAITLKGANGKNYHYVLPAVYRLIQHLHDTERDFNFIIRTYGLDCGNVLNSISHTIDSKEHPQFPDFPDIKLDRNTGRIIRDADSIKLQVGIVFPVECFLLLFRYSLPPSRHSVMYSLLFSEAKRRDGNSRAHG